MTPATYGHTSTAIFTIALIAFGSSVLILTEHEYNELRIKCLVDGLEQTVMAIQIKKEGHDNPMATISLNGLSKMASDSKAYVEGDIHTASIGYLTLIIFKPDIHDVGSYKCELLGLDERYNIIQESAETFVNVNDKYALDILLEQWMEISTLTATVIDQKKNLDTLNEQAQDMSDYNGQRSKACRKKGGKYYNPDKTCLKAFGVCKDSNLTWYDAKDACNLLGGDLVQIENHNKSDFVIDMFDEAIHQQPWIGIRNHAQIGLDYRYVNGSDIGEYQPWVGGKSWSWMKTSPKCVGLVTDRNASSPAGRWFEYFCNQTRPHVCSISVLYV